MNGAKRTKLTLAEILKSIIPPKSAWRIEVITIIAKESQAISSYRITGELAKRGFKTRVNVVHSFLELLVKRGICMRPCERVSKKVEISEFGKSVAELLEASVDSGQKDNE